MLMLRNLLVFSSFYLFIYFYFVLVEVLLMKTTFFLATGRKACWFTDENSQAVSRDYQATYPHCGSVH
jgi:hypothetical protein